MSGKWTIFSKVDVRNMGSILCPYPRHQRLMSRIWTVFSVHVPDIKDRFPESGQVFCPSSRHHFLYSGHHCPYFGHHCSYSGHQCPYSGHEFYTKFDVCNIDSKNWPYPGYQKLMSRTWTEKTVHIPDIKK